LPQSAKHRIYFVVGLVAPEGDVPLVPEAPLEPIAPPLLPELPLAPELPGVLVESEEPGAVDFPLLPGAVPPLELPLPMPEEPLAAPALPASELPCAPLAPLLLFFLACFLDLDFFLAGFGSLPALVADASELPELVADVPGLPELELPD